jgi:hypothetical protein
MGKASTSKKVSRVARTGGGRTRGGQSTSWFWPVFVGIVVVLGTAGIVYSKDQRQPDNSRPRAAGAGRAGDHWHAAFGVDICGKFAANLTDQGQDTLGIHTHGEGVVHIHPFSPVAAGKRATLGVYFKMVKATITSSEVHLPGQPAKKNGEKCGDKPAEVRLMTWPSKGADASGTLYTGRPEDLKPSDGELITVAFLPKADEIPRPESASELDRLSDVTSPTSVPGETTVPGGTTVPGEPAPTTAPPGGPSTSAPASAP